MQIDPLVVAVGFALCLIPVIFGLLIASWRLPFVERENPSVTEMLHRGFDMRPGQLNYVDEKALHEGGVDCDCASCQFWGGGFFQ